MHVCQLLGEKEILNITSRALKIYIELLHRKLHVSHGLNNFFEVGSLPSDVFSGFWDEPLTLVCFTSDFFVEISKIFWGKFRFF